MNRRKINQEEVQPQEDTVVLLKPQRKKPIYHQSYSLLRESSNNKRKGNPISTPSQSSKSKLTPVSIDGFDANQLFYSTATTPLSKPIRPYNEVKRRTISKPHGLRSGKATVVLSNDDEDKYNNSSILGIGRKEDTRIKKPPIHFLQERSPSSSLPISLSKKQKGLGTGRLSTQSSLTDNTPSRPPKPYHRFSQNHQHTDTNCSLPYNKEQPDQRHQTNQHRRFVSSSDEDSIGSIETKKKTTIMTTAMDTSDNDDVYHSACSISSDVNHDNSDNGNAHNGNNKNRNTEIGSVSNDNGKEQLINPPRLINKMRLKNESLNPSTIHIQQRLTPTLPTLPPSSSTSSSSSKTITTTTKSMLHRKDDDSPAPVELSDDEMDEVNDTILFTYPINRSKGSITVTVEDQKRLGRNQFLNDSIIDFYLKFLMDSYSTENGYRICTSRTRTTTENTHIFSSFFYNRLTHSKGTTFLKNKAISYENVRKWTSKIDLFSKKYAIFPINENWHWYLVLVCNLDKCIPEQTNVDPLSKTTPIYERPHIFVLDSLGKSTRSSMTNINRYLLTEAQHRRNVEPSAFIQPQKHYADVPRQDNSCDCGVFLLHFVDQFLNSPQDFTHILLDGNSQHAKWKEDEIKEKRAELKTLFRKIHGEYRVEHGGQA